MNTISINDLKSKNIATWSVRDDSPRGISTKMTSDLKVGDKVVIDNHFVLVVD